MQVLYLFICILLMLVIQIAAQSSVSANTAEEDEPYPRDVTQETLANPDELARLQSAGEVFFQEDFELPGSLQKWYNRIGEKERRTQVTIDPKRAHSGDGVLELRTEDRAGEASGAGCSYWFHPGYDTLREKST